MNMFIELPGGRRHLHKKRLLVLSIAFVLVCYLAGCTFILLRDSSRIQNGILQQKTLVLEDFTFESVQILESENGKQRFVSTDHDPQLIYTIDGQTPFAPGIVSFDAQPHLPSGEMVLYYTTKAGQGFSDTRRVWAFQQSDGSWQFDLTGKLVYAIRLDPDSVQAGVVWQVNSITIGMQKPAISYYLPDARLWLVLLGAPWLVWAVVCEGFALLDILLGNRFTKPARALKGSK